jgi:hypothetical protein
MTPFKNILYVKRRWQTPDSSLKARDSFPGAVVKTIVQTIKKKLLSLFHVCIKLPNETDPRCLALPVHEISIRKRAHSC